MDSSEEGKSNGNMSIMDQLSMMEDGDDSSSSSRTTALATSSGRSTNSPGVTDRHQQAIGKEETRMVYGSKILVIIVLGVATMLCAAGAYIFGARAEHEIFRAQVKSITGGEATYHEV